MQIRDMPEDVRRRLKARAAGQGQSLSEYVRTALTRDVSRPTPAELSERIKARGAVSLPEPSEVSVRRLRDEGE